MRAKVGPVFGDEFFERRGGEREAPGASWSIYSYAINIMFLVFWVGMVQCSMIGQDIIADAFRNEVTDIFWVGTRGKGGTATLLKVGLEASVGLCNFSLPSALILCQLAFTLFLPEFEVYFPHSIFEGHFDGTMVPCCIALNDNKSSNGCHWSWSW